MKRPSIRNIFFAAALFALLHFTAGCATEGEFGDRTAVVVYNQKPEKIVAAAVLEFGENGYTTVSAKEHEAVFEKRGSAMQGFAYGSWMDQGIWERATLTVEPYSQVSSLVEIVVERVTNKNDDFFSESKKLSQRARKPYQLMLDKIVARLDGIPPVKNAN